MSALIYVSLDHVHPVVDGKWHRVQLAEMPEPGQVLHMLCGLTAPAEYERTEHRDARGPATQCWSCDFEYRRIHGIDMYPDHPGRPGPRPVPHPR
ncbi:zinc finger protein [Amycolatopsis samaneae]|uniref:Zinc finger protein n=1 Tax=Amycolatopsis samaneae TaxID=664691 RepID=A0ABW5GW20_9PSEU